MESQIDKIKKEWEIEKAKLMEDKDAIQAKCSEIQNQIKLKKEDAQK